MVSSIAPASRLAERTWRDSAPASNLAPPHRGPFFGRKALLTSAVAHQIVGVARSLVSPKEFARVSVAFTKEESAETASETLLPDRPISEHANLVTEAGLKALRAQLDAARKAYDAASAIQDVNDRRREAASPLREVRYFTQRVRTAQLVPAPVQTDTVAFGSTVTFSRDDGRIQKYRIVGEDEADPKSGSISYVSPLARALMGKAAGDVANLGDKEIEIVAIS
jgi:transcription elongation GreA/GreB family factor